MLLPKPSLWDSFHPGALAMGGEPNQYRGGNECEVWGGLLRGLQRFCPATPFTSVPPSFLQGPVGPAGGPGFPGAPGAKVSALVVDSGAPFPHNLC